jgi:sodium transport system permease protein
LETLMRWSIAYAIFRKEILETLRDRRTLVVMLLLPLLLYPVMMIVMTQLFTHQMSAIEKQTGIVLVKGQLPPDLAQLFDKTEEMEWRRTDSGPLLPRNLTIEEPDPASEDNPLQMRKVAENEALHDWARRQIQDGFGHVVIVVPAGVPEALAAGGSAGVLVYYDETDHVSRVTEQRVTQLLIRWERQIRLARDEVQAPGYTDPVVPWSENTANAEERGGFVAGQVLPVMLMVMVMLGAFYPAIDLTAGEQERGTMQTLMTAPAQALEIIVGKFLTVVIVALISAVANLMSMGLAFMWILGSASGTDRLAL